MERLIQFANELIEEIRWHRPFHAKTKTEDGTIEKSLVSYPNKWAQKRAEKLRATLDRIIAECG